MSRIRLLLLALLIAAASEAGRGSDRAPLPVTIVESVGFTVSEMERALAFYTRVLPFTKISDVEVSGRDYELLSSVFGAPARIVRLRLGDEYIELIEYPVAASFRRYRDESSTKNGRGSRWRQSSLS